MDFNIFQAFINRMDQVFPGKKIYTEHISQKREFPSLTISTINATMRREMRGRFWVDFTIAANYLPEQTASEFDIEDVKFKMAYALERLPIDEKRYFQATNSEAQVIDRAVIGTGQYSVYFKEKAEAAEFMADLEQDFTTDKEAWENPDPEEEEKPRVPGEIVPGENNNPKGDREKDLMRRLWRK